MRKLDLTGQVYGRLTVLKEVGRTKKGAVVWKCLCECGNIVDVTAGHLRKGDTKSCGCLQKERTSETNKKDLTNQKFGRLTVLDEIKERNRHKKVLWKCRCECGTELIVKGENLVSGNTKSCGCIRITDLTNRVFGRLIVLEEVGRDKRGAVMWRCLCSCGNEIVVVGASLSRGSTKSCGCYNKERITETQSGEKNHNWKGGITPIHLAIRASTKYCLWRKQVFQRDSYTCQHCGDKRGGNLHAHHIKRFSVILEEFNITTFEEALQCEALWGISNGLTLCKKCHKKEHPLNRDFFL